jgi:hypothetical protein
LMRRPPSRTLTWIMCFVCKEIGSRILLSKLLFLIFYLLFLVVISVLFLVGKLLLYAYLTIMILCSQTNWAGLWVLRNGENYGLQSFGWTSFPWWQHIWQNGVVTFSFTHWYWSVSHFSSCGYRLCYIGFELNFLSPFRQSGFLS